MLPNLPITRTYLECPRSVEPANSQWRSLAELAVHGLQFTYSRSECPLPHTCRWDGQRAWAEGHNPRYALIALLGLAKAQKIIGNQEALCRTLWDRIARAVPRWRMTAGDFGLGLWADVLHGDGRVGFTVERALRTLEQWARKADSVDFAWLLLGAEHARASMGETASVKALSEGAKNGLLHLYSAQSRLFFRHKGTALGRAFTRRVPCFANQIYPVMALALHVQRSGCPRATETLRAVADELCARQGPLGQWCWLYDARNGGVVDPYPIFSVHQDGMAPMALMEAEEALGQSFQPSIDRGLAWILGQNERKKSLVLADEGLVLRDIHRRGVGRVARAAKAFLCCCGLQVKKDPWADSPAFVVNAECRPYHLGWILYAAALACEGRGMASAR